MKPSTRSLKSALCLATSALLVTLSSAGDLPVAAGPFNQTPESLKQYRCPEWFRDAKFGIWSHWGPQSVPCGGDWYARNMYVQGSEAYNIHTAKYGHPSKVGYKDIVALWKAEKFDPDRLMELYKKAGAKYFVSMGAHHDNFDLWNSKHFKWNAVAMGPHKDIVGLWAAAARKQGLRFGVTDHLERSYSWFNTNKGADTEGPLKGVPYDGNDPKYADFYFPPHADSNVAYPVDPPAWWPRQWFDRMQDLLDNYHPDLFYSDGAIPFGEVGRSLLAHFYNANMKWHGGKLEAVYNIKDIGAHGEYINGACVEDCERGALNYLKKEPWQTDASLGDWFYNPKWPYMSTADVVSLLVNNVSKNGNLLMNIVQRPDGTIDPEAEQLLEQMAAWNAIQGEAIYGTRPWSIYGEGSSESSRDYYLVPNSPEIRFTTKGPVLYAIVIKCPSDGRLLIHSLAKPEGAAAVKIKKVSLLGYAGKLDWSQIPEGLLITLPGKKVSEYTTTVKVELSGSPMDLLPSVPPSITRGKSVTASSVWRRENPVAFTVDGDPETFWSSNGDPNATWLEIDLGKPQTFSRALILEAGGKRIEAFSLQAWQNNGWVTFLQGTTLGSAFGKIFPPVTAQRVRLLVTKSSSNPCISEFDLFPSKELVAPK